MRKILLSLAAIVLLGSLLPIAVLAEEEETLDPIQRCTQDISASLNRERFLYEKLLFGVANPETQSLGSNRTADDGSEKLKTDNDAWVKKTDESGGGNGTYSDKEMKDATATDPLPPLSDKVAKGTGGILSAQHALTSELLPPLLQSYRAFRCRVAAACNAVLQVYDENAGEDTVETNVPGCEKITLPTPQGCLPTVGVSTIDSVTAIPGICGPIADDLVSYERGQLLFLVHYDAAHRSLRQFAGATEPFLNMVRFPFLEPLQQAVNFFHQWQRVPCFSPFCANSK